MSYDLMVFDPKAAPSSRKEFLAWFRQQTKWGEGHRYNNPDIATPELRAWFVDMIARYPAIDGPYAVEEDGPKATDYSVGHSIIYAGFAWSEAEHARELSFSLAGIHRVGFFDVSADGGIWIPTADGQYSRLDELGTHGSAKSWWQFWK